MLVPKIFKKSSEKFRLADNRGSMILYATIFGVIAFSVVIAGVSGYAISENRASVYKHGREMAFQIAEAPTPYITPVSFMVPGSSYTILDT